MWTDADGVHDSVDSPLLTVDSLHDSDSPSVRRDTCNRGVGSQMSGSKNPQRDNSPDETNQQTGWPLGSANEVVHKETH